MAMPISTSCRDCAGHSHWQNVRHVKEAKDAQKAAATNQYVNRLRTILREGGSRDPANNAKIAAVFAQAKSARVPLATLDRFLKKADAFCDPYLIGMRASGGLFSLVESTYEKKTAEKDRIAAVVKKYGFKVIPNETDTISREFFNFIGVVICEEDDTLLSNEDQAMELGLEVGAEEAFAVEISDTERVYQFQCDPKDVNSVAENLVKHGVKLIEAETRYLPHETIKVSKDNYAQLQTMYDKVRENTFSVERFFDNIEVEDS